MIANTTLRTNNKYPHAKQNQPLDLYKKYNADEFPKFDNYETINVNKTADIPMDWSGVIGVPITFLDNILPIIQKYDKSFQIITGKRNFENVANYQAIANGTCTTFTIDEKYNIIMNRGQMFAGFIITHIDLLDKVLDMFYNRKYHSMEDRNTAIAQWAISF